MKRKIPLLLATLAVLGLLAYRLIQAERERRFLWTVLRDQPMKQVEFSSRNAHTGRFWTNTPPSHGGNTPRLPPVQSWSARKGERDDDLGKRATLTLTSIVYDPWTVSFTYPGYKTARHTITIDSPTEVVLDFQREDNTPSEAIP